MMTLIKVAFVACQAAQRFSYLTDRLHYPPQQWEADTLLPSAVHVFRLEHQY